VREWEHGELNIASGCESKRSSEHLHQEERQIEEEFRGLGFGSFKGRAEGGFEMPLWVGNVKYFSGWENFGCLGIGEFGKWRLTRELLLLFYYFYLFFWPDQDYSSWFWPNLFYFIYFISF
jgi:hypothetical protein